ncbi:MAG: protein kinase [Vicinamibacterales bacterium]
MTLAPGSRLGAYEVDALIGTGGMGEVYRATDTRLHRAVALKVLPESFAADRERVARFEREAQLLASLNHPNIASIYGIEPTDAGQALVLELVDGPTLADRIAEGALPIAEALPIARQIADALAAAHDHGVIHRDLKPANIKVRDDGTVKVLDFGLAKAVAPDDDSESGAAHSPTITAATRYGVILGTAAYMSPEQAKGKTIDRRSDVWAFGCVLYEMLTGSRVFEGEDVSETLASVLRAEPSWHLLPADTPEAIRRLLRRCLERDRRRRLSDVGVACLEIDETAASGAPAAASAVMTTLAPPWWRRAAPIGTAAIAAGAIGATAAWMIKPPPAPVVVRARHVLPSEQPSSVTQRQWLAVSPDGSTVAYFSGPQLYLRTLSDTEGRLIPFAQPISGGLSHPAFSPDGQSIAFFSFRPAEGGTVHRVAVTGGPVETIAKARSINHGLSWGSHGILIGAGPAGILRVAPTGGDPSPIVTTANDEDAAFPMSVPGSNAIIYTAIARGAADRETSAQIRVQDLASGTRRTLTPGSNAAYVPTGHLIYTVGGTLFGIPFDPRRLEITGARRPVVDGIRRSPMGDAHFSVSATGTLVFAPGPAGNQSTTMRSLSVMDRTGRLEPLKAATGAWTSPRVSPDGKRLVFGSEDGNQADILTYELDQSIPERRLTFAGRNRYPIWSRDGQRVAFQSDREGDAGIFWQRADTPGTAERLTAPDKGVAHVPESWSPVADIFLFSEVGASGATLWSYSLDKRRAALVGDIRSSSMLNAEFSRDGQWIAYTARGAGMLGASVFVEPFPPTGARFQIQSETTAHHPVWMPNGQGLSYRVGNTRQVIIPVRWRPSVSFGAPAPLPGDYPTNVFGGARNYDVLRDGQRFVFAAPVSIGETSLSSRTEFQIVVNWFEELKQRMAAK